MLSHEYFQELSALAAIGQLSSEENRELENHLLECTSCSEVHQGYALVIQHQLPKADAIRWQLKSALQRSSVGSSEIRTHFLARARAEGIEFSPQVEQAQSPRRSSRLIFSWRPALALTLVAVFAVSVVWFNRTSHSEPAAITPAAPTDSLQAADENDDLRQQLLELNQLIQKQRAQISGMKDANSSSGESQQQLKRQLEDSSVESEKLAAALQEADSEKNDLVGTNQQKDATIATLRARNDKLDSERADLLAARTTLEIQVRNLNETLQQETADLERERQLSAVSSDIRQLMGARNLHLVDVHDVYGGEKNEKAFGRIFYAEGKTLVFYAFDLPSRSLNPAKYAFKAWGQREDGTRTLRNLGTFEVDSQEQRRWVLKVNDSALLTGIDSVFVTAELPTDVKEPHGIRLLYAYIAGKPNHP
jgi:hypothetical protein